MKTLVPTAYLAVVSQEVVPVETGTAHRRSCVQTSMRAMPVVLVQPGSEMSGATIGVGIGTSINPLAQSGLDETFGFAVGAWGIGTSEDMAELELA